MEKEDFIKFALNELKKYQKFGDFNLRSGDNILFYEEPSKYIEPPKKFCRWREVVLEEPSADPYFIQSPKRLIVGLEYPIDLDLGKVFKTTPSGVITYEVDAIKRDYGHPGFSVKFDLERQEVIDRHLATFAWSIFPELRDVKKGDSLEGSVKTVISSIGERVCLRGLKVAS